MEFSTSEHVADAAPVMLPVRATSAPKRSRAKRLTRVDKRSPVGKRIGELKATFTAALESQGREVTPMLRMKIETASQALATAELARGRYMRGDGNDRLDAVMTAERLAERAVRGLHLPDGPEPKRRALAEHLAAKAAGEAA